VGLVAGALRVTFWALLGGILAVALYQATLDDRRVLGFAELLGAPVTVVVYPFTSGRAVLLLALVAAVVVRVLLRKLTRDG
jgi:hypothetical protein